MVPLNLLSLLNISIGVGPNKPARPKASLNNDLFINVSVFPKNLPCLSMKIKSSASTFLAASNSFSNTVKSAKPCRTGNNEKAGLNFVNSIWTFTMNLKVLSSVYFTKNGSIPFLNTCTNASSLDNDFSVSASIPIFPNIPISISDTPKSVFIIVFNVGPIKFLFLISSAGNPLIVGIGSAKFFVDAASACGSKFPFVENLRNLPIEGVVV